MKCYDNIEKASHLEVGVPIWEQLDKLKPQKDKVHSKLLGFISSDFNNQNKQLQPKQEPSHFIIKAKLLLDWIHSNGFTVSIFRL